MLPVLALACASRIAALDRVEGGDAAAVDPFDLDLFGADRVVQVTLALDAADWGALRSETRTAWDVYGGDCLAAPFSNPFRWFDADITIDGVPFGAVSLRKKGFLGSLSRARPSLKLDFDRDDTFPPGRPHALTLNNSLQDATALRTCLAYETFAAARVRAPRCGFAHVTVNEEDLGIYVNVEPIDDAFLAHRDLPLAGGLYEGTLSDFRDGWSDTFSEENDAADTHRLDRVATAVQAGDLDSIGEVVDLDSFYSFYATEILLGRWDGYSRAANNFFVYDDPSTGSISLLPWGTDDAVSRENPFGDWMVANSALTRAVMADPEAAQAVLARLQSILDGIWDAGAAIGELEARAAMLRPYMDEGFDTDLDSLEQLVEARSGALQAGLAGGVPVWVDPLPGPPCFESRGSLTASFATTWGTLNHANPFSSGSTALALTWDGVDVPVAPGGAVAGPAQGHDETAVIVVTGTLADGSVVIPYVYFPSADLPNATLSLDFADATGALLRGPTTTSASQVAFIAGGELSIESSDATELHGEFSGTVYSYGR